MITNKNLKKIVEEFSQPREELGGKSFIANRHEWFEKQMENVRPLLQEDALDRLSVEDARRIYDEMSVGGPKLYPKTYIENGLEKIKTALRYLLYGDDPVAERFYNFAGNPESDYRLNGLGKAFASTALHLTDPNEFPIWNGAVDGGLKLLGMFPKRKRGEHIGETYDKITEVFKELQAKCGFEDLSIVDEFLQLTDYAKFTGVCLTGEERSGKLHQHTKGESVMMHPDEIARLRQKAEDSHRQRCLLLCRVVDEFCPPPPKRDGPGRPVTFSDNLIIKIDMLGRLSGIRGETELLRHLDRHYRWLFPELPSQSWLWRRLCQVLPMIEWFRRYLRHRLGVDLEDVRIIDTLPVPVFTAYRRGRGNGFDLADWGHCASKNLTYFGFKLGWSITPGGIPDVYDLFSARPHDINVVEDLLDSLHRGIALGDKGFISQEKQNRLVQRHGTMLITYKRCNQKARNTPLEQWILNKYRQMTETVGSQLVGLLHLQNMGAKTDIGLAKRVIGALTAFTLGIYLNFLLGRKLLAVKALFA